jgi:hypothetical protein
LRNFRDTEPTDPSNSWMFERIGELYEIEREVAMRLLAKRGTVSCT